ncbi:MAG: glycogen/starch/alpha-glucan phosphorylase [Pyrinomonadaceae bacterium]|nr:glycogen/starch/alpha-glucan phosphorylase [Pyrinomonadaceae bacterium]
MEKDQNQKRAVLGQQPEQIPEPALQSIKTALLDHLFYTQGRLPEMATRNDWYMALAHTVRDRLLDHWIRTVRTLMRGDVRVVSYLSAEFLIGPQMGNNLINLGIYDQVRQATAELGLDLDALLEQEEEPGLGNGGLGRLAACYLESLATLEIPAIGYGIRYEFGIFDQEIRDGWQVEVTDKWLQPGNPWEIPRPEIAFEVNLGGHTEIRNDPNGSRVQWIPHRVVKGVAYDTPVVGYQVGTTDLLRLWKAEAAESFDFEAFNVGDYYGAVEAKIASETITKVLYPNDTINKGKQLRLEQQYFFVSCSLQDMLRINDLSGNQPDQFHEFFAVQLNDTHPSIAVAELMRLLVDVRAMDWDQAWYITQQTFGYTNHTLLPEALEAWSLPLFRDLLPRHLEIIYEINRRFLDQVRAQYPGDDQRVRRMSLIDESGEKYVRMAYLATVGSHAINGVAALHSELLKKTVLHDFYDLYPERFHNVTNGVTPRRWMVLSNPRLTELITKRIGDDWIRHTDQLKQLEAFVNDAEFREQWREVKRFNKRALAKLIKERTGIVVDPESLFDVQVKRFHEYKRQLLNALHVITLYRRLKANPSLQIASRTFIFGGKAAPGYAMAKLIIKLINSVAEVVNNDKAAEDRLKVVFLPDFNVKNGQMVYPAADLSEQISTAGKEASGTGNMKFALNGALTIGTLDGANIEIRDAVGANNFFLFGLTAPEVGELKAQGYNPRDYYHSNGQLREVIDLIGSGAFSNGNRDLFRPIVDLLLDRDEYLLLADYQSYVDQQEQVSQAFSDPERWTKMSILNVARMGHFSSDRSIQEYCDRIWHTKPVKVEIN